MRIYHGEYIGDNPRLLGLRALLQQYDCHVLAQFDDTTTGLGYYWWHFHTSEFEEVA